VWVQACDLLLLRILPTCCLAVVAYPMVGLHATDAAFLLFLAVLVLTACVASTLNLIFSVLTADIARANLMAVMAAGAAMMFGGLLTNGSRCGLSLALSLCQPDGGDGCRRCSPTAPGADSLSLSLSANLMAVMAAGAAHQRLQVRTLSRSLSLPT
jgi:hypothetical protein